MAFDPSALAAHIDAATASGRIVGCVIGVAHCGEARLFAAGHADREAGLVMSPDAVFRLASLTKAVVCVAALAAAERGTIALDDPVTRWLPWFAPRLARHHADHHAAALADAYRRPWLRLCAARRWDLYRGGHIGWAR